MDSGLRARIHAGASGRGSASAGGELRKAAPSPGVRVDPSHVPQADSVSFQNAHHEWMDCWPLAELGRELGVVIVYLLTERN